MTTYRTHIGFTLIEMIATVAVLAILVTVGIPSFQETIDKRRLTGAAEQLYGDLQYARSEAIKRNANVFVTFTGSGTTWCYGMSATTATCNCTTANSCALDGVEKVVNQTGFRNISLGVSNITNNNLNFEPRRGLVSMNNNALPIVTGEIEFTSNHGASNEKELRLEVSRLGRVKMCSPSGNENVSGYPTCPGS